MENVQTLLKAGAEVYGKFLITLSDSTDYHMNGLHPGNTMEPYINGRVSVHHF